MTLNPFSFHVLVPFPAALLAPFRVPALAPFHVPFLSRVPFHVLFLFLNQKYNIKSQNIVKNTSYLFLVRVPFLFLVLSPFLFLCPLRLWD